MKERMWSISSLVLLAMLILSLASQGYAYDASAVSGTITCTGSTVISGGQAVASGTASLVADGAGNWTSGTASYQITSGQAQGGTCNYKLGPGSSYVVKSDGTGTSITHWRLSPGSSSACRIATWGADELWMPTLTFWGTHDGGLYQYGSCAMTTAQGQ